MPRREQRILIGLALVYGTMIVLGAVLFARYH